MNDPVLADGGLDQLVHVTHPNGRHASLRRLVCALIEEHGQHTGHADLLREAADERVGEVSPAGWRPKVGQYHIAGSGELAEFDLGDPASHRGCAHRQPESS